MSQSTCLFAFEGPDRMLISQDGPEYVGSIPLPVDAMSNGWIGMTVRRSTNCSHRACLSYKDFPRVSATDRSAFRAALACQAAANMVLGFSWVLGDSVNMCDFTTAKHLESYFRDQAYRITGG